jgi:CRP/FNR family cyclic AMP-dependent transcriptional regulator
MVYQSQDGMAKYDLGVTVFLRAAADPNPDGEPLVVPQWKGADWELLFSYTQHVKVSRDDVLIRQNAAERTLYFVESGRLEVTSVASGLSLRAFDWFHPGSVVGELAFLDGKPRAAGVCAIVDSELYRLDFQDYLAFADAHPRKACDLVLAIGRLVALRLRHTLSSVKQ